MAGQGKRGELPFESIPLLEVVLEPGPQAIVMLRVFIAKPDSNDVVYKTPVEQDLFGPAREYIVLVYGVIYSCPWRCGCNAHASTGDLSPVCVPKLQDVIFKDDFNPYLQEKESRKAGVEVNDYKDYQQEYEAGLRGLLEELYDPEVAFNQTDDLKKCAYCPYMGICGR